MKKRFLILFANSFPYNISEPFLENEYPLYREYFDKVLLVTACRRGEQPTRILNDPAIEVIQDYTLSKDPRSIMEALPWLLTDRLFYAGLKDLIFRDGLSPRRLYDLLVFSLCGNHRALQAHRWLKQHPEYQHAVLYSYWLHIPAYAAVRLNQKNKNRFFSISRAHGYDLYLERSQTGSRPFHKQLYHRLDEIASISAHGKQYLEALYGNMGKVSIHRLGAVDQGCHNPCIRRNPLRIVTCSRTIPLKRLDRLVDALALITDRPIHWTHLGGGESQESLERYAAEKLPSNVTVSFSGTIPNTQVYEIYKHQPFHVFVNVSETEGVPVAIMEAMSFDIPVIATAVGGTPELMEAEKNGWLLPKDFSDSELADRIRQFADMPEETYLGFRRAARSKFEREYNAAANYRKFLEKLSGTR